MDKEVRPCDLTQRIVNLCEVVSDAGTSTSCEVGRAKEDQRRPSTKMDQLRAMVQETSRQVGTAIGQVKVASQCYPPAKDSGATNYKADWFTQLKLTEPTKPYFDISDSGPTGKLLGHSDPGNVQDVHEHSNTLRPSSPRSPTCLSARSAFAKSSELYDFVESFPASTPSSPQSSKNSSAGSSVSSSKDLPTWPSTWMQSAVAAFAKPQDSSHTPPRPSSAVVALGKSQEISSSTDSCQVACQRDCNLDEEVSRWQPLIPTMKNGRRSSRELSSRSRRLLRPLPVHSRLSTRQRSGKSSSRAPRWKLLWGDDLPH